MLLGSASPDLMRQSGESLAGRISTIDMAPLTVREDQRFVVHAGTERFSISENLQVIGLRALTDKLAQLA